MAVLKSRGIPQKLIDLTEDLYTNTVSCVQADGVQSDWFTFSAVVRQGCNIAPDLFLEPMDWVMDRTVHRGFAGISVGSKPSLYRPRFCRRRCRTVRDAGDTHPVAGNNVLRSASIRS